MFYLLCCLYLWLYLTEVVKLGVKRRPVKFSTYSVGVIFGVQVEFLNGQV
jgi:hypothetical protein